MKKMTVVFADDVAGIVFAVVVVFGGANACAFNPLNIVASPTPSILEILRYDKPDLRSS